MICQFPFLWRRPCTLSSGQGWLCGLFSRRFWNGFLYRLDTKRDLSFRPSCRLFRDLHKFDPSFLIHRPPKSGGRTFRGSQFGTLSGHVWIERYIHQSHASFVVHRGPPCALSNWRGVNTLAFHLPRLALQFHTFFCHVWLVHR